MTKKIKKISLIISFLNNFNLRIFKKNFRQISKKKLIIIFTIIIAFLSTFFTFFQSNQDENQTTNNFKTFRVHKSDINKTIKVLGKAELVDEQKLRFNQTGKIITVNFKDGDEIKKDQIIAELDKSELYNEIRQAEISLQNSRLSLQELLKGNTKAEILRAQNSVIDTQKKIDIAEKNLAVIKKDEQNTLQELENEIVMAEKDVTDKKQSLKTAQSELENTKIFEDENIKTSSNSYNSSVDDALLETKDALLEGDNILVELDNILCMEENTEHNNDSFESYLGASSLNSKQKAESAYIAARTKRKDLQTLYQSLQNTEEIKTDEAINLLSKAEAMMQDMITASDNTYFMLQNTFSGSYLSASQLDSYKISVMSSRTSGQNALGNLKNTLTNLNNLEGLDVTQLRSSDTIRKKEDAVRTAQYALEKAEDTLKNLKNTLEIKTENKRLEKISQENEVNNLKNTLQETQEELAELERGETEERLIMAKNDITQKELALSKIQKNVEKYELRAPFDGILRKIDFKVGDNLILDDDKFAYIENPNLLKITILLDQIDVVKVQKNYRATIIFDALPDKKFWGEIEEIDQTPLEQSGVISYETSITLNKEDEKIFSGMTSTVEIIIAEKKDVLAVPSLAIQSRKGKNYVKKIDHGNTNEVEVEIGLNNGQKTEIIKGLNQGDEIVEISWSNGNFNANENGQDTMRQFMRATRGGGRK